MSYSQPHPYTPEQTLRVELINQELSTTGMTAEELNCGFALQSVKEVLANKCTINPEKVIAEMWQKLFGEAAITEIEKTQRL